MAVSAFRSTSKRGGNGSGSGNSNSRPDNKKRPASPPTRRRSRSVSAIPNRTASSLHHFSNKTDNPLFSSHHHHCPPDTAADNIPSSTLRRSPAPPPQRLARSRSVSRPPSPPSQPESESDRHSINETRGLHTWSSRHPPVHTYTSATLGSIWDDAVSTSPLSESDEKNDIKSVLDESQERARKLRAYLAIEEQRGQELNQILNEMLPSSELQETRNSRSRRKASIERHKMSKRLMEEAMIYFDECISISTFDNSDFSAPEDTPFGTTADAPPEVCSSSNCLPDEALNTPPSRYLSFPYKQKKDSDNISQSSFKHDRCDLATENSSDDYDQYISVPNPNREQSQGTGGFLNLKSYVQKFVKVDKREIFRFRNASTYDADESTYRATAELLLCDVVIFKKRIEYGGLHLCGPRMLCDI